MVSLQYGQLTAGIPGEEVAITVNAFLTVGSSLYIGKIGRRQVPQGGGGDGDKKGPQSANH
jgi:hypothetical protein